jgi:hypothetical protein
MAQANEPNNYDRQLRHFNRRLERLEDTHIAPQEFDRAFDRVYTEIDELKTEVRELRADMDLRFNSLDAKFEILMNHIIRNNE